MDEKMNPQKKGFHPTRLHWLLLEVTVFLIVVAGCFLVGQNVIRRNQFAPLDRILGKKASDPKILLQVIGWKIDWEEEEHAKNPYGLSPHDAYTVKHLALVRLLDLQPGVFQNRVARPAEECMGGDAPVVRVGGRTAANNIVVVGTPSLNPDYEDSRSSYSYIELFEFTPTGRLVRRQCYSEGAENELLKR